MGLMDLLPRPARRGGELEARDQQPLGFNDWLSLVSQFSFNNVNYSVPVTGQEQIGPQFVSLARLAYITNGPVFACMAVRARLFSEARFMLRKLNEGRPGDIYDGSSPRKASPLEILRNPWPNGTTGDLLHRMITHADLAGNAFVARRNGKLSMLRPDWVTIVSGVAGVADATMWHPDAEVLAYIYQEGGPGGTADPVVFDVSEVAHFAPVSDPMSRFRGMSWLTPVVREIMGDKAMTEHKLMFMENAATPQMVVKFDIDDLAKFRNVIAEFRSQHEGSANAYKTLFLNSGADVTPVGKDLSQIDFKSVQGAGETRIAAAAGVHPVIVGLSEGLAGSSLNAGNFQAARRLVADATLRPLWREAAACLSAIVDVPADSELWYDECGISFLQEDAADAASIQQVKAVTTKTLIDAGFDPDSVVEAVEADDLSMLQHTGLYSVQLQPAGTVGEGKGAVDQGVVVPAQPQPPQPQENAHNDALDMLERDLMRFLREREPTNISVNVEAAPVPDVNVNVEPAQVTVEPARVEEGAVQVHVEAAPVPDVNVNVEPAQVTVEPTRFEEGAVQVTVEPADVHVDVQTPDVVIAEGAVRVDPAVVQVPETVVNVAAPNVTVEPAQVTVENIIQAPNKKVEIQRDRDGLIKGAKIEDDPVG